MTSGFSNSAVGKVDNSFYKNFIRKLYKKGDLKMQSEKVAKEGETENKLAKLTFHSLIKNMYENTHQSLTLMKSQRRWYLLFISKKKKLITER